MPLTGSNAELWTYVWNSVGSCLGMSANTYFKLMTSTYAKYNPNVREGDATHPSTI